MFPSLGSHIEHYPAGHSCILLVITRRSSAGIFSRIFRRLCSSYFTIYPRRYIKVYTCPKVMSKRFPITHKLMVISEASKIDQAPYGIQLSSLTGFMVVVIRLSAFSLQLLALTINLKFETIGYGLC